MSSVITDDADAGHGEGCGAKIGADVHASCVFGGVAADFPFVQRRLTGFEGYSTASISGIAEDLPAFDEQATGPEEYPTASASAGTVANDVDACQRHYSVAVDDMDPTTKDRGHSLGHLQVVYRHLAAADVKHTGGVVATDG